MVAGTSKIDITPSGPVWMDGMIRDRKSEGIHDPIFARTLVISPDCRMEHACAFVSVEVCGIRGDDADEIRRSASMATGIHTVNIIIAATHTHSGPAIIGFFNPREREYLALLRDTIVSAIAKAAEASRLVLAGCASGRENTISHYRRLLAKDGHVVMNWEPYPRDKIVGPLGAIDPEVGIIKIVDAADPGRYIGILYNHAGHPNVMSGDNYLISGDYPGLASRVIEEEFGCVALFMNGAEGTMDIDGLRDRDWKGIERTGRALAAAVSETVRRTAVKFEPAISSGHTRYTLPARNITADELKWAHDVLNRTGGVVKALANGVGHDYKALLFERLHARESIPIEVEQTCCAIGDSALISFPGELFTEIGMSIKSQSPFKHTLILGLANGEIGYVPTAKAVSEGGYEVETREVGDEAGEMVLNGSLSLLDEVNRKMR